jgi:hypothetical protein
MGFYVRKFPCQSSKIADALKDTFYFGIIKAKGKLLPHKHEPIISYEFFQKVEGLSLDIIRNHFSIYLNHSFLEGWEL